MATGTIKEVEQFTNIGYSTVTVTNGTGTIYLAKYGAVRFVCGSVKTTSTGTYIVIGNVGSGNAPPLTLSFATSSYSVSVGCEGNITTGGDIRLNVPSGGNANSQKFSFGYVVQ